jgi:hypothetical protein
LLQLHALAGQGQPLSVGGVLVQACASYLRQPVLAAQYHGDFVEVEAEQGLQLPDAGHPGQVLIRVARIPPGVH